MEVHERPAWTRRAFGLVCAAVFALTFGGSSTARKVNAEESAAVAPSRALRMADALPSWQDGSARQPILKFAVDATREGAPTLVPPAVRLAALDGGRVPRDRPPVAGERNETRGDKRSSA
jgi:hypothetical protein